VAKKKKNPLEEKWRITRDLWLIDEYLLSYQFNRAEGGLSDFLNEKRYTAADTAKSYRQVNAWDKQGLLLEHPDEREKGGWRKFCIIDLIWLAVIGELRDFGMSWEKIKIARKALQFDSNLSEIALPVVEPYFVLAIASGMPIKMVVFADGGAEVAANYEYMETLKEKDLPSHIIVNINGIINHVLPDVNLKANYEEYEGIQLSREENEIIAFMRMGEYEKIEIRYKEGKPDIIEGTQRLETEKRLLEVMKEHKYQSIELHQQNGNVVSVKRKVKQKIGNNEATGKKAKAIKQ
jgi:DNA-binding transcriptional MerR regulator